MSILVTGAAGFIGFHTSKKLLERGEEVLGIDSLNPYYDVNLKEARLRELASFPHFHFMKLDIADREALKTLNQKKGLRRVIHLAAQAGVRYSIQNPYAYVTSNLVGHLNMLEWVRSLPHLDHMVYASSSSVYGNNTKLPFAMEDRTDTPISLYAATKKADELMSHAYGHLFELPLTGLRFFTVYGPWGRPDMAAFIFTKAILNGEKIPVFNQGDMRRNFTYIEDIVEGVLQVLDKPGSQSTLYNMGNNRSEKLLDFIQVLEHHLGRKAHIEFLPLQPGDVKETLADIDLTTKTFGFTPRTHIQEGLGHFVAWYRRYYG